MRTHTHTKWHYMYMYGHMMIYMTVAFWLRSMGHGGVLEREEAH